MEQEVAAADFVLVVCTPSYAHKSDSRQGGVGYEQQIVSGQLMSGTSRSKFIPILRNGEYNQGPECAIPTHFGGIAWIDFRNEALFDESFEDLVRVIFSKPRFAPPPLGTPPHLKTISATKLNQSKFAETARIRTSHISSEEKSAPVSTGLRKVDDEAAKKSDFFRQSPSFPASNVLRRFKSRMSIQSHSVFPLSLQRKKTIVILISLLLVTAVVSAMLLSKRGGTDGENRIRELIQQGKGHFDKGEFEAAIADYTKAIEMKPDDAKAYFNRGAAYSAKGDMDLAIANYTKAIEMKPDDADAYFNRGNAYSAKGDKDLAIADYTKAIEIKPDDAEAYFNRGNAYSAKGDKDLAIADYRKSRKLFTDPSDRETALQQLRRLGAE
jgi:tetratricopeptide (TPR) repeat protein